MKGHLRDLPTLRLRCASYLVLLKLRKEAPGVKEAIKEIKEVEEAQTGETFRWKVNVRGVWGLSVNTFK